MKTQPLSHTKTKARRLHHRTATATRLAPAYRSLSQRATDRARAGELIVVENPSERSPKQENL